MATAITVKEKIQGLIIKSNNITGANDTTLSDAVDTLIESYGEGGSEIVVDVSAFPIDGIDQNKIYRLIQRTEKRIEVYISGGEKVLTLAETLQYFNDAVADSEVNNNGIAPDIIYEEVDSVPTEEAVPDEHRFPRVMNYTEKWTGKCFILKETGEPYLCVREMGVLSLKQFLFDGLGILGQYIGVVESVEDITENNSIATIYIPQNTKLSYGIPNDDNRKTIFRHSEKGWAKCEEAATGELTIDENGVYDVAKYATAKVEVQNEIEYETFAGDCLVQDSNIDATWVFSNQLIFDENFAYNTPIYGNFESQGQTYIGILVSLDDNDTKELKYLLQDSEVIVCTIQEESAWEEEAYKVVKILSTEVDATFEEVLRKNAEHQILEPHFNIISFNGMSIKNTAQDLSSTLDFQGTVMMTDMVIKFGANGFFSLNGSLIAVKTGQTVIIPCEGKLFNYSIAMETGISGYSIQEEEGINTLVLETYTSQETEDGTVLVLG